MGIIKRVAYLCLMIIISGCTIKSEESRSENIIDIDEIPVQEERSISQMSTMNIPSYGIMEFEIVDSLMIVSTLRGDNLWTVYSIPDGDSIMSMFQIGGGPLELDFPVPTNIASFTGGIDGNHMIITVPQPQRQKYIDIDLTSSIKEKKIIGNERFDERLSADALMSYDLSGDFTYSVVMDHDNLKIIRKLETNNSVFNNNVINKLNDRSVEDETELSVLLTRPIFNRQRDKIADISGYSGSVYIYDIQGNDSVSLHLKGVVDSHGENLRRMNQGTPVFFGGTGYDKFFIVTGHDYDSQNDENISVAATSFYFIGWDGTPLGVLTIKDLNGRCPGMDLERSTFYVLNQDTDEIMSMDLSEFMRKILLE